MMNDTVIQKMETMIRAYQMIRAGDHIIAGVSGGADSICLLLGLLELREVFGHEVSVVHVEHGIRGEEAHRDAAFVRSFCGERGIECHIRHCRVPEYARLHGMSEEEAGRELRYQAFRSEAEHYAGQRVKIAVAHHLGDQAETMLFHLARGTGIRGLAGIAPVRGDIIRPLLTTDRTEIEQYLAACGQEFCQDATNAMDCYSRNRIRHQALPALERVNSQAAQHMYQTAQQLREIHDYLKKQAVKAQDGCCVMQADGVKIKKEPFLRLDPVIQKEMIHELLEMLAGGRDLTRKHVSQVLELFDRQNSRRLELPGRMQAVRVYGGVELYTGDRSGKGTAAGQAATADGRENQQAAADSTENQQQAASYGRENQQQDIIILGREGCRDMEKLFSFRIREDFSGHMSQISKKKYTKCFDYDKIKVGFCVRNRQPGDYLVVDASGSCQKLKKYLVNEKVPVTERDQLLLLADGAHIMWVVGYRISSYYKVEAHTRRILEVTFCGGEEDEGTDSGHDLRG